MDILANLNYLNENMLSIEQKLGDGWPSFRIEFFDAAIEVKRGNRKEGLNRICHLFLKHSSLFPPFSDAQPRRTRGITSPSLLYEDEQKEQLLMNKMNEAAIRMLELSNKEISEKKKGRPAGPPPDRPGKEHSR